MEANKEKINRLKVKTRIQLPIASLPALPQHLLLKKIQEVPESEDNRISLKTINSLSGLPAGPSTGHDKVVSNDTRCTFKVDSKYVTLRKRNHELDWHYEVFQEETNNKDSSIISISDDEGSFTESDNKEYNYFSENKQKKYLGGARRVTPLHKSLLAPNIVRNIKRPHSRELLGLSPEIHLEKKGEEKFKRRLKFNERLNDTLQLPDIFEKSYTKFIKTDYVEDLFSHLLNTERTVSLPIISSNCRARLLNWLLRLNGSDGNPAVIQTASWYMDSLMSIGRVRSDNLQPIAVASYWIAQKFNGRPHRASWLIKCSNGACSATKLSWAEKAILNILKFPSKPVVPHDYITYLSWWLDNADPGEIELAATFFCLCGLMVDKTLYTELPSVIAAACVKSALLLIGKRDLMLRLETCPVFQAAKKKTTNTTMCRICSTLRRAVLKVSDSTYKYKAPIELFGIGPHFIAQRVVEFVKNLALLED